MNENLKKLRELTDHLPSFPPTTFKQNGYSEFQMKNGTCQSWYLYEDKNKVGVHKWFNAKGTIFPKHQHKEKEWLIIYEGETVLHYKGKEYILKKGDSFYTEPSISHWSEFIKDTSYITISIPESKLYPHEKLIKKNSIGED